MRIVGQSSKWQSYLVIAPLWGVVVFAAFYLLAAALYPGGSNADACQKGFSLLNNYWCDLLNPYAKNGAFNSSRPVALAAMIVLCSSLICFWYFLPQIFNTKTATRTTVQIAGIIAMLLTMFVFTKYHDQVINYASLFGAVAFIISFRELYRSRRYALFGLGLFAWMLCLVCYLIYRTGLFVADLPVIQKITFFLCLCWFGIVDFYVYKWTKSCCRC